MKITIFGLNNGLIRIAYMTKKITAPGPKFVFGYKQTKNTKNFPKKCDKVMH